MASGVDANKLKAAAKEGAKKGQDLQGLNEMGGLSYFHLALENAEGNLALVQAAMDAANKEVDEKAEDRKGGAGHLGKIFLSAGDEAVAVIAHVPQPLQETVPLREWFDRVTKGMTDSEDIVIESQTPEMICAYVKKNMAKEKFPLKMRDAGINAGFAYLHEKKLITEDDDDDVEGLAEAAGIEW